MDFLSDRELVYYIRVFNQFVCNYGIGLSEEEINWAFSEVFPSKGYVYC